MQRWSIWDSKMPPGWSGQTLCGAYAKDDGRFVEYVDAEAYAEEKAREAVAREREEIATYLENIGAPVGYAVRIRSRGEAKPVELKHFAYGDEPEFIEQLNTVVDAVNALLKDRAK